MDTKNIVLAAVLAVFGSGIVWIGSGVADVKADIAAIKVGVENNAKAIAELRADMKEGDAELRELILLHITGQHSIAEADVGGEKKQEAQN